MPILAVDSMGKLYVTSPDREDGLGHGGYPEVVDQGDLTLGASYLKAQSRRTADLIRSKRIRDMEDRRDQNSARFIKARNTEKRIRDEREAQLLNHPDIQMAATKKALNMGCACDSLPTRMSGNGLTSNGQTGIAGLTRDQQTIQYLTTGFGHNQAYHIDPSEMEQHQHNSLAMKHLRSRAR